MLAFENITDKTSFSNYYLPKLKKKMLWLMEFLSLISQLKTTKNIWKRNLLFVLPTDCIFNKFDFWFFLKKKKNEKRYFRVRKRSIDCSLETLSANKSLEILHFPSLCNAKASCKITIPCVYRCIKVQMLTTNVLLLIPELALVHNCAHKLKERQAWS